MTDHTQQWNHFCKNLFLSNEWYDGQEEIFSADLIFTERIIFLLQIILVIFAEFENAVWRIFHRWEAAENFFGG